jgi:hypothetical protein
MHPHSKAKSGRRCTPTTFRLARGRLDETSRPRSDSDSYEAPSAGRLDRVAIRTRPAQQGISTTGKLRLVRPRVESLDLSYPPTLSQKSEQLMRLPTTSYRHGYSHNRRGNNACVSPHFFTTHPGMGGESLSLYTPYRTLFHHRPPSRTDTTRSVSHDPRDSALSAQPRPSLDPALTPTTGQQERKADVAQDSVSFHRPC